MIRWRHRKHNKITIKSAITAIDGAPAVFFVLDKRAEENVLILRKGDLLI